MRETCSEREAETNLKSVRKCTLQIKGKIVTNLIKEAIRIADSN